MILFGKELFMPIRVYSYQTLHKKGGKLLSCNFHEPIRKDWFIPNAFLVPEFILAEYIAIMAYNLPKHM